MPDYWTCKMRCVSKRFMPQADSPDDHLYSFVNVDSDGTLTQIIEDDEFCEIGEIVDLRLSPLGESW